MSAPGVSAKYLRLPCLFNWLTGKSRGVKILLRGADRKILSDLAFPYEVFDDLLARVHKNVAGGDAINFYLPEGVNRQALEELINGLEIGDSCLQVEENGDIKLIPASIASLSSTGCLGLGDAESLNKTGLTSEAQAALPGKSIIIVGQDAHRLYTENELLQCKVTAELPIFCLGTQATSLEQIQSVKSVDFDVLLFLFKRFNQTSVSIKPVLTRLAACFVDGFDAFYELDSLYTGKWKKTCSFESVYCFALRQLVNELSRENLIIFLKALQENNCWEALAFIEEQFLSSLQKKDPKLAEVLASGFLRMGHLGKAAGILNSVPEELLSAAKGQAKGKKAKGRRHRKIKARNRVHPLAGLVAKVGTINIAQKALRTKHMCDAFDRLCKGEIDLEGFDKLRLQVMMPEEGGRVFSIPWTAKRSTVDTDYKSDLSDLKRHFFERFDPEKPALFDKVREYAQEDFLFYDLLLGVVEQVYLEVIKGGELAPKEGKLLELMLPLARQTREFLPSPKAMRKIQEKGTAGNPRFLNALRVFNFIFVEIFAEAKVEETAGRFEEAWQLYQMAYELLPKNQKLEERIVSFLCNWRKVLFNDGDLELMNKISNTLLSFRPNDIKTKLFFVISACQQGDYALAISMGQGLEKELQAEISAQGEEEIIGISKFEKVNKIPAKKQELLEVLTNLGNAYITKYLASGSKGDLHKAIDYLDRAAKINPQYPALNYYQALTYAMAQEPEKSLKCMDVLVEKAGVTVMPMLLIFITLLSFPAVAENIQEKRLLSFIEMVDVSNLKRELLQESDGKRRVSDTIESKIKESIMILRKSNFINASERVLSWFKEMADSETEEEVFNDFSGVKIPLQVAMANSYLFMLKEIDDKRAVSEAERIVGKQQNPSPILLNILANLYLSSERYQEAVKVLEQALGNQTIPYRVYPLFNLARGHRALGNRKGNIETLELLEEAISSEIKSDRLDQFKSPLYYMFLFDEYNQSGVMALDWEKLNTERSQEFFAELTKGENPFIDRETGDITERFAGKIAPQDFEIESSEKEAARISEMLCGVQEGGRRVRPVINRILKLLLEKFPAHYAQAYDLYQEIARGAPELVKYDKYC